MNALGKLTISAMGEANTVTLQAVTGIFQKSKYLFLFGTPETWILNEKWRSMFSWFYFAPLHS